MSIERTIRGGAARLRPAISLSLAMIWVVGCATPGPGVSRLAGTWEAVDTPGDQLVIQPDGTFDLSGTMMPMAGDVSRFRRTGDMLAREHDPVRFEIVASEYGPTISYFRMKATSRSADGGVESEFAQYHAELAPDGTLRARIGPLAGGDAGPDTVTPRVYRRIGDAPPVPKPPPVPRQSQNEWIALGRRHFAGENWFARLHVERLSRSDTCTAVLLRHRDEQLARRFLVVRVSAPYSEDIESALASSAAHAAKLRCSILFIALPEVAPYGRPADETVARLADMVAGLSREAIERVGPAACGLETQFNATYVGHYLWQRHAVPFDGWFCRTPHYFRWYGSSPIARRQAPILLLQDGRPSEPTRALYNSLSAAYSADGFDDLRVLHGFGENPEGKSHGILAIVELAKAAGAGDLE